MNIRELRGIKEILGHKAVTTLPQEHPAEAMVTLVNTSLGNVIVVQRVPPPFKAVPK